MLQRKICLAISSKAAHIRPPIMDWRIYALPGGTTAYSRLNKRNVNANGKIYFRKTLFRKRGIMAMPKYPLNRMKASTNRLKV